MSKTKRKGLTGAFIIIAVILIIDQLLKIWVKTHMSIGPFIEVDPASVEPVPEEPCAAITKFSFLYRDAGNY